MKDYNYYIPGYTGFCPDLHSHYGERYGDATRQIIRERPRDLLKERLSAVRYRCRGRYSGDYGDHSCCMDHPDHHCSSRLKCRDGLCCKPDKRCKDHDKDKPLQFGFVCPPLVYLGGYNGQDCDRFHVHEHGKGDQHRMHLPHHHHPIFKADSCKHDKHSKRPESRILHIAVDASVKDHEHSVTHEHDRGDLHDLHHVHLHHPAYRSDSCQHDLIARAGKGHYDESDCDPDARTRLRPKVLPFRYCGVIPKYTGHIPNMQFVFGETYGPASDRLLRRHHDTQRRMHKYR